MSNLFANYNRLPVSFKSGQGCHLIDINGRTYLDFLSGIAVTSLGHSHPKLVEALTDQVQNLLHVSNLYEISQQELAAQKLVEHCGQGELDKVFFCNSGAEANECLLKLARKHAHANGMAPTIVVAKNGFHGRTLATVSATGTPKYHEGFSPLMPGFQFVDFNDLDMTKVALSNSCGILIEPIQGEGGVIPADSEYLLAVQEICRQENKLLLLDEVQTGIGRTGHWLCAHHYGVTPDAVSLAKGLGSGIPVGAVMAKSSLSEHLCPGTHGTTFGGNPLACRAVCAVLDTIDQERILQKVQTLGDYAKLELGKLPGIKAVRGMGLMLALVTERPAKEVTQEVFDAGLLVNAVRDNVIRLLPPLVVTKDEIDQALEILKKRL